MRVAAYTGGKGNPSARARVRQYLPSLRGLGIAVREYPLPFEAQMPTSAVTRIPWMVATTGYRLCSMAAGLGADATWVCRQFLPTYLNVERMAKKPIVLDVDDAIWMTRGGKRVEALARSAAVVVCGNAYLAAKFSDWNANIAVIPTAVDTDFYEGGETIDKEGVTLGWVGTSGNFPYLATIQDALRQTLDRFPKSRLLIVADRPPPLTGLASDRVEFVRWTPAAEQQAMRRIDIGLMPMQDTEWAQGKCSYKMLCYMAAAIPVVVSPFGMNAEVLRQGDVGFGPVHEDEWCSALAELIENRELRQGMGAQGRALTVSTYSVIHLAKEYARIFQSLGTKR
jgi:glycosyltransferase involved in cell wall biosynthesis